MKKITIPLFLSVLFLISLLALFNFVFAQEPGDPNAAPTPEQAAAFRSSGGLVPCTNDCTLCDIVVGFKRIFDWLMGLLFIATILIITVAGVFYMVSSGNKAMIDKAKQGITYALSAFVIGMGCWLMVNVVMTMLGFKNAGSWWQFECDTSSAWTGAGTGGTGNADTSGSKSSTPFQPGTGCAGTVKNAQGMLGWAYTQDNRRSSDGFSDCSSLVDRAYQQAGCSSPGDNTAAMFSKGTAVSGSDKGSLKAGDLLVARYTGKSGNEVGHVVMCEDDGCNTVIHASEGQGKVVEANPDWMLSKENLKAIRASDLCSQCNNGIKGICQA